MSPALTSQLQSAYQLRLDDGELRADIAQIEALRVLQSLIDQWHGYAPKHGFWDRLGLRKTHSGSPAGLYLFGDVGRGKSMLMDLFYDHVNIAKKRRVHFHQFMLEIHQRLHELSALNTSDILPSLARDIAKQAWLVCFDEFYVSNIADAMILGRLFAALFAEGVKIVATTNWPPDELYKNGLQRDRFLPFIDIIKQKMLIHELAGATDHRYEHMHGLPSYFYPLGEETTRKLQGVFFRLTDDTVPESMILPVQGRSLNITHAARGVGFFNFDELCVAALGAADYLAIAECLHTVILDGVPKLDPARRNETTRLMTLIDTLYEAKVKLFMGLDVPVDALSPTGDLAFPFQRTISRLVEMQGDEYRAKAHLG